MCLYYLSYSCHLYSYPLSIIPIILMSTLFPPFCSFILFTEFSRRFLPIIWISDLHMIILAYRSSPPSSLKTIFAQPLQHSFFFLFFDHVYFSNEKTRANVKKQTKLDVTRPYSSPRSAYAASSSSSPSPSSSPISFISSSAAARDLAFRASSEGAPGRVNPASLA